MQVRIRLKSVAALLALVVSYTSVTSVAASAAGASTPEIQETKTVTDTLGTTGDYEVTDWWKAELSEYQASLTPVSYEVSAAAETNTDEDITDRSTTATTELATTTAVTTTVVTTTTTAVVTTLAAPTATEHQAVAPQSGSFVFTTYGYGHGVGLSQNGANFYAMYSGWNYQQILNHYFPGTVIANTGLAEMEQITVNGVTGNVLDMVSQVVYNEVGCSMSNEAIKAQAVAVYTYIKYNGNSGRDLRLKANPPENVVSAVRSVLGEAVYYNGAYALTFFYASSGGSTASCKDIFYQDLPYLVSVGADYDAACDPHYGTAKVFTVSELKRLLETKLGITLSADPANWITIVEGDGGYAASVIVDNQVCVKGNTFRSYLGLKSPKMTYTYAG